MKFILLFIFHHKPIIFQSSKVLDKNTLSQSLKCNISRKKIDVNLIFCMQINIVCYKLILFFFFDAARHAQSTQNKLEISQHYFKKQVRDKSEFLREGKHQNFQQADATLFGGLSQAYPCCAMAIISFICQSKTINFVRRGKIETKGPAVMFS